MSSGKENSDISESLSTGNESKQISGTGKSSNVKSSTLSSSNPNKAADSPQGKGRGNQPSEADSGQLFTNWGEFVQFLKDTYVEFRKISWPTRQQVLQETWSVIVLVSLLTTLVLAFDWGVAKVVFEPLDKFAKKMGGGVGNTMQTWGPTAPAPGAPVNNPAVPATRPETPSSSPDGRLNMVPTPSPAPAGQPATSDSAIPSAREDGKPDDSK